jgi:hypothetical protein
MQKFDLIQPDNAEVNEQYQVKISNRSAAMENLYDKEDIDRTSENKRLLNFQTMTA